MRVGIIAKTTYICIMIVLLMLVGGFFVLKGVFYFLKGVFMLFKAFYYRFLATEKQLDNGYQKHVIKETKAYKDFESDFDSNIDKILNPE